MRRGEVYWAEQPAPIGSRPVLLLSRDAALRARNRATVAYATTQVRGLRSEVRLTQADGMPRASVLDLDSLATIPLANLRDYITTLGEERMRQVEDAIHFALRLSY